MCVAYALIACVRSADYTGTNITFNSPRFLPDGLLVTGGQDTRNHIATWVVLMTIATPSELPDLQTKLTRFKNTIDNLRGVHDLANETISGWDIRIAEIADTMHRPGSSAHRDRRGLFNAFGDLSKALFGTATDADVQEVKNQLRAFGATNRKVVHYVSKLITVVNHTHVQLSENRRHIVTLHTFCNQLSRAIRVTVTAMNSTKQRLTILETKLRIEQILRSLEASHEYWLRQVMTFNRQKAAMELGFLTEDLVSRQDLMHIVKSGLQAGFYAPAINWFYSNIRVSPIAWTGHQLIFRVKLPLTDNVLYKRYSVWSWPIPGNSTEYNVEIQVPSDFAIHTVTGGIFQPTFCQGEHPMICRAGAIFDRTRFQCPRGILTAELSLRKQCRITLTKVLTTFTTVHEILPGVIVILTRGEKVSLLCSGDPELRLTLLSGAYVLRLRHDCHVKAEGWSISGITRLSSTMMVDLTVIDVPPMPILQMIPPFKLNETLKSPVWTTMGEIKNFELSDLPAMDYDDTPVWGSHAGHVSWSSLIVLFIVTVLIIYILYVLYRRGVIGTPNRTSDSSGHTIKEPDGSLELREMNPEGQNPSTPTQTGLPAAWQNVHPEP